MHYQTYAAYPRYQDAAASMRLALMLARDRQTCKDYRTLPGEHTCHPRSRETGSNERFDSAMLTRRLTDVAFFGAVIVILDDSLPSPYRDYIFFVPWLLARHMMDSLSLMLCRHSEACVGRPCATDDLRGLHLACGYSEAKSSVVRMLFGLQAVLAGYALWRAGVPGWVSLLALALLLGLYTHWFMWRHHALDTARQYT